ncbi:MAG: hypothetical protein V4621_01610 [Pseudomonadota bacterium]
MHYVAPFNSCYRRQTCKQAWDAAAIERSRSQAISYMQVWRIGLQLGQTSSSLPDLPFSFPMAAQQEDMINVAADRALECIEKYEDDRNGNILRVQYNTLEKGHIGTPEKGDLFDTLGQACEDTIAEIVAAVETELYRMGFDHAGLAPGAPSMQKSIANLRQLVSVYADDIDTLKSWRDIATGQGTKPVARMC